MPSDRDVVPKGKELSPIVPGNASSQIEPENMVLDKASEYDYCMVLKSSGDYLDDYGKRAVDILTKAGFELFSFRSTDKESVFVLLRAPLEVLRVFSDKVDFPLLLDPVRLEALAKAGEPNHNIAGFEILHDPAECIFHPYEHIYGTYKYKSVDGITEDLYWRPPGHEHPFREIVRLRLIQMLVEAKPEDGTPPIKIQKDLASDKLLGFFPMHNLKIFPGLAKRMMNKFTLPWHEPQEEIKEYFGEKIGLYFVFMAHMNTWLFWPAIAGFAAQLIVWASNNYSHPILPCYAAATLIWGIIFLEYWKRKEIFTSLRWGTIGFESNQADRAEFFGSKRKSYVNGDEHVYYPTAKTSRRVGFNMVFIFALIGLVIGAVAGIYVIKYLKIVSQSIASIMNSVQIQIFNLIYGAIADYLTEAENHRTSTAFEDSLISKLFLFQFVNSYTSFFYLAFISENLGGCIGKHCMRDLSYNLGIVFAVRLFVSNLTGLLIPYVQFRKNIWSKGYTKIYDSLPRPEKEELRASYNPVKDSIADNAEIVIQFGYMMLFVTALPMAATASALFSYLQVKGDGYKLLYVFERPIPMGAEDIGTWQNIYFIVTIIAVLTNAGIVVFTMVDVDGYTPYEKMWIFIGIILACYFIQFIAMEAIPDVPKDVDIQIHRQEHLVNKVIEKIADDVVPDEAHFKIDERRLSHVNFQSYPQTIGTY